MGSRICRVQIFPHIIDLTNSNDQGGGFIGFAKRIVHPFSDTEPDCYLNSNAPADLFNIMSSQLDLTACARLGEGDRTKETQMLGSFGNRLLHCCRILLSTGLPMRAIVKRCGDFDCFVSCFLQFCANCIVVALARLRGSYNRKENPPR